MPFRIDKKQLGLALMILAALPLPGYAIDKRFEIEPAALAKKYPMPAPSPTAAPAPAAKAKTTPKAGGTVTYRVKRGDYLVRVLEREYGLTGRRAKAVARRVKAANGLASLNVLQVGATLVIPLEPTGTDRPRIRNRRTPKVAAAEPANSSTPMMIFSAPAPRQEAQQRQSPPDSAVLKEASRIWPQVVADAPSAKTQLDYLSGAFSLSLDPQKYPVLAAQDGGAILVDGNGSLPPLVKSLLQEKNPQMSIVSERPDNPRNFYRALLEAAHFYSFEEDFLVDIGTDCKVTVQADFKIEKNQDSLLRQDITLLKVAGNRPATPQALVRLLAANGFKLVETAPSSEVKAKNEESVLYLVREKDPRSIADALLDAIGIRFQSGKNIDLYAGENNGVQLVIPVHRYFEKNGNRFVLSRFGADPLSESLTRLLENKGYQVIPIQDKDDLQSLSDKLLKRLDMTARYGEQDLWSIWETGYGVRMPGVMLTDGNSGGRIFITDRKVDPLVQELARQNGYRQGNK
ncbi:MAG TPA: hypothetical protein DCZ75_16050 [Geobacter sp.]|nr:hypothetical protein [Geobacter sp.]